MPFKDPDQAREYAKRYMRRRRAQPAGDQEEAGLLNPALPALDRTRPYFEIPRPFPLSALAEQDGHLFDLATGKQQGN